MLGLWGGNEIDVGIDVAQASALLKPGDQVNVLITLKASKGAKVREVRAGLVRVHRYQLIKERTDSDGDEYDAKEWRTDEQWITNELVAGEGRVEAGVAQHSFTWTLPHDATPSFAGAINQICWLVKVTVDRKFAKDISKELELHVGALRPAHPETPAESSPANSTPLADVQLRLPQLILREGEAVQGQLVVQPSQQFDVRGIRVELVRQETVTAGDKHNTQEVTVQRIDLGGKTALQVGMPLTYEFVVPIPEASCPTHQTAIGGATWLVKAVLDRPMKSDIWTRQNLVVVNAQA